MKFSCLIILCILTINTFSQNAYTINNLGGYSANFSDLQKAVDSVPSGSILYVHPSPISYGNIIIKKKVILYGNGFFLGQNVAPNTQANVLSSTITSITFKPGSDGSLISGVSLATSSPQVTFDTASNITLERSFFGITDLHFVFGNVSNILIRQSYISSVLGYSVNGIENTNLFYARNANVGVTFQNNIISGGEFGKYADNYSNINYDHNTIFTYGVNFHCANSLFTNNILIKQSKPTSQNDTTINFDNLGGPLASSSKNISNYTNYFNTSNNKLLNRGTTIDSLVLTRINSGGITSDDGYFILKTGSAGKGYSTDNTDCGAFGGSNPYILSGIPPLPNLFYINVSENATINGGLKISIKANANN